MFGYVLPLVDELTVSQFLRFRRCYCGLCRTLGREYGQSARLILNYDFTFLAMLLWPETDQPRTVCRACPVHPLSRRCSCAPTGDLAAAAGCSVILAWHKLADDRQDESFPRRTRAAAERALLARAYRKAARALPDFDRTVREHLDALRKLEEAGCTGLDETAEEFAAILASAGDLADTPEKRRIARELLYHVGRWVYVMDARQDLKEDLSRGCYNVLAIRCGGGDALPEAEELALRRTADASRGLAEAALALWPTNPWSDILQNILTRGMDAVSALVFADSYRLPQRRLRQEIGDRL